MDKALTKQEASDLLGISISTLNRKLQSGALSYYKYGDSRTNKVFLQESEIMEYKNRCKSMIFCLGINEVMKLIEILQNNYGCVTMKEAEKVLKIERNRTNILTLLKE